MNDIEHNRLELLGAGWIEAVAEAVGHLDIPEVADEVCQIKINGLPGDGFLAFYVTIKAGRMTVTPGRYRGPDVLFKQYQQAISLQDKAKLLYRSIVQASCEPPIREYRSRSVAQTLIGSRS